MLLHVAVEHPNPREGRLETEHGPGALPELEAVLAQWSLEILGMTVLDGVVFAAPEKVLVPAGVVVIREGPVLTRTRVDLLRHEEARRTVHAAPAEVGQIDDLEDHAVHVDTMGNRGEVIQHDLDGFGTLRDVENGYVVSLNSIGQKLHACNFHDATAVILDALLKST